MSLPPGWILSEVETVALAWRLEMSETFLGRLETVRRVIGFLEGDREFLDETDVERLDELIAERRPRP